MDVLELDAASRTEVDNIRELQEVISYAPARDRYKILIIDEAHMLSKAAFNALLKTLEEPPPNVDLRPRHHRDAEGPAHDPLALPGLRVPPGRRSASWPRTCARSATPRRSRSPTHALERIARAGEGSVRDSLSVLERVLAFCGKEVEDDDVLRMLGGVRLEVLDEPGARAGRAGRRRRCSRSWTA